jgi:hypothetical protein
MPRRPLGQFTRFFTVWGINPFRTAGLHLELGRGAAKSAQAMCFMLRVPGEIHVLMQPQGGWIDLETLWHELGHGLSAAFTSEDLPLPDREMAISDALSETYAFLLQNMVLSKPLLENFLCVPPDHAEILCYYKVLKDLSVFRRYAAKFLCEYEMFCGGNINDGERYARMMARYTGFRHQAESQLFDLVPEFYCLDYVLAWMGEAILEDFFKRHLGPDWMFQTETGGILKSWWAQGNRFDIFQFFEHNQLGRLEVDKLVQRWEETLSTLA